MLHFYDIVFLLYNTEIRVYVRCYIFTEECCYFITQRLGYMSDEIFILKSAITLLHRDKGTYQMLHFC